ncbi:MAG: hypothetical protein WDN46_08155 [Methylocella sp.]
MSAFSDRKHIGDLIDIKALSKSLSWTAGSAQDNVPLVGNVIDRLGFPTGSLPQTLDVGVLLDATLAAGATLSVAFDVQDSADGVNFADYATVPSAPYLTGPTGGGHIQGVARLTLVNADNPNIPGQGFNLPGNLASPSIQLDSARRFIRLTVTPHLSSATTDTAVIFPSGVFAGFDTLEAPVG